MTPRRFTHISSLLFCFALTAGVQAQEIAPAEKAKIEALIGHLEGLKSATFIRNGTDYDSKAAAKFLRGKWKANSKAITTAAEFIAIAGTRSSTSGKPYLIRLNGAPEISTAEYLTNELKKLEAATNK